MFYYIFALVLLAVVAIAVTLLIRCHFFRSLRVFCSFLRVCSTPTICVCVLWAVGLIYIVYNDRHSTTALIPKVPFAVISLNEWSLIKLIDFGCYQLVDVKPKEASREKSEFTCFGLNENLAFFAFACFVAVALALCWCVGGWLFAWLLITSFPLPLLPYRQITILILLTKIHHDFIMKKKKKAKKSDTHSHSQLQT